MRKAVPTYTSMGRRPGCVLLIIGSFASSMLFGGERVPTPPPNDFDSGLITPSNPADKSSSGASGIDSAPANFDEVVMDLVQKLTTFKDEQRETRLSRKKEDDERDKLGARERYNVTAQDAARKLVSIGKRSIPALALVIRVNLDKISKSEEAYSAVYYAAWALARIRSGDAADALIPILRNTSAHADLRAIAVDALGWEKSDQGALILQRAADSDPDIEIRKRAFGQLSMIPEFWVKAEPAFVRALSDPNDEIRTVAAKACHFSHIFLTANDKLIQLIEKDPVTLVRVFGMLTLARMKVRRAQPALARILASTDTDEKLRKQALTTFITLTEIQFRDTPAALAWWEKTGKDQYDKYEATQAEIEKAAKAGGMAGENSSSFAPVVKFNTAPDQGSKAEMQKGSAVAEIIDADGKPPDPVAPFEKREVSPPPPPAPPPAPEIPRVRRVSPPPPPPDPNSESTGTQRRRARRAAEQN